jgi:phosphoadenosine phosphosulfate reductase
MIKKRLQNGDPCPKCAQTEDMLRRRGLWDRIDEVVWAVEGESASPGALLGTRHAVDRAPFFVVRDDRGTETVFLSALQLIRKHLSDAPRAAAPAAPDGEQPEDLATRASALSGRHPSEILKWGLERYGEGCAIRFDGADDVVLIDMAAQLGLPVAIFAIDSGRLRSETHTFLDAVRDHYGVAIDVYLPDAAAIADLVRRKGPNSFLRDGHAECCALRRVAPQQRALAKLEAWVSGRRNDQSLSGAAPLAVVSHDSEFAGAKGPLVRLNPLANWTRDQVWAYIEERQVPVNELHAQGFVAIGCEPCTRPTRVDQPIGDGLWWWERPSSEPDVLPAGEGI